MRMYECKLGKECVLIYSCVSEYYIEILETALILLKIGKGKAKGDVSSNALQARIYQLVIFS